MKNLGGPIILLAAFIFVGAILAMAFVATTEYQQVSHPDRAPSDPMKIQESRDELQSTFRIGIVLGIGAVLVLFIGLATLGTGYLQNKTRPPAVAIRPEEREQD